MYSTYNPVNLTGILYDGGVGGGPEIYLCISFRNRFLFVYKAYEFGAPSLRGAPNQGSLRLARGTSTLLLNRVYTVTVNNY